MKNSPLYTPKRSKPRACRNRCPGGDWCCLDASIPHTLHICGRNPKCVCHSRERYDEALESGNATTAVALILLAAILVLWLLLATVGTAL